MSTFWSTFWCGQSGSGHCGVMTFWTSTKERSSSCTCRSAFQAPSSSLFNGHKVLQRLVFKLEANSFFQRLAGAQVFRQDTWERALRMKGFSVLLQILALALLLTESSCQKAKYKVSVSPFQFSNSFELVGKKTFFCINTYPPKQFFLRNIKCP
jgi:hypothetical protein